MSSQTALFKRANHSNLGKGFENELDAVHKWYRLSGKADIIHNPNEWVFVGERQYGRDTAGNHDPGKYAVTNSGRKMIRTKSDVDFSGGGRGFAICFDAKETKGSRLPVANIKPHQIQRMVNSERCGCIAGFIVKFSELDRVFFVTAFVVRVKENDLLKQTGRRAKAGTASLSVEELEQNSIEIFKNKVNGMWDWLPALVPSLTK